MQGLSRADAGGRDIDRQEQNGLLFQAFFDKAHSATAMQAWVTERLYRNIRGA